MLRPSHTCFWNTSTLWNFRFWRSNICKLFGKIFTFNHPCLQRDIAQMPAHAHTYTCRCVAVKQTNKQIHEAAHFSDVPLFSWGSFGGKPPSSRLLPWEIHRCRFANFLRLLGLRHFLTRSVSLTCCAFVLGMKRTWTCLTGKQTNRWVLDFFSLYIYIYLLYSSWMHR